MAAARRRERLRDSHGPAKKKPGAPRPPRNHHKISYPSPPPSSSELSESPPASKSDGKARLKTAQTHLLSFEEDEQLSSRAE